MDPFSVTVGIAGLVGLAATTIKSTNTYIQKARNASKAASELLDQLKVLQAALKRLDGLFSDGDGYDQTPYGDSILRTSVRRCEVRLGHFNRKLMSINESRLEKIKWPFNEREHKEAMQDLRTFTQFIHFAIAIESR